ncbi:MAG: exodeoxyribonuclease VII small subunit [Clostridia bacterium]|nr:exodeoxyribonuclease VII small subunit [Clostridia bacterium]
MTEINDNSTYEELIARINEIVKQLENPESSLDASVALFEEGVKLIRRANKMLEEAEQKVKFLTESET